MEGTGNMDNMNAGTITQNTPATPFEWSFQLGHKGVLWFTYYNNINSISGSIASNNFDNLCHLVSLSASQSSCFEDTNCCINQCLSFCFMLVNHHWFPSLGAIKTISNQNNCDLIRQMHYYLHWHNHNGYLKDSYILMSWGKINASIHEKKIYKKTHVSSKRLEFIISILTV